MGLEARRRDIACLRRHGRTPLRNARTRVSSSGSRKGGGWGIQRFSWNVLAEPARNSLTQSAISSGDISSAPQARLPPAFATAMESDGGHAPAIAANRMGTRSAYRLQKTEARCSEAFIEDPSYGYALTSRITSSSTGEPSGRLATPITSRDETVCSPRISRNKSDAPSATFT